jgi:uncharacterized Zn ribbon protein
MAEPTSPVVYDLTKQPLPAKVDTNQTKDSEGYYYRQGDFVEIAGDETVKISSTGSGIGVLQTSIHENQAPDGLDSRHRVAVLTRFKACIKATANGTISAGDMVKITGNKAVKLDPLSQDVDEGGTATYTIAWDARDFFGLCWKGGADGEEVLILV